MSEIFKNVFSKTPDNDLLQHGFSAYGALKIIYKELEADGLTSHDLGSYTTIEMLPEADFLIHQSMGVNMVNQHEYHKATGIHENMVKTIARFLHAPNIDQVFGSSTTGSSESIFLAILAAKWEWKKKNNQGKPNIVFCSNAHLCWYKFSRYLDVEIREVPLEVYNEYPLEHVLKNIDHNTISVVAILGSTSLGTCDPINILNERLEKINKDNNWDVGIHIDAAIGGFVVPFLDASDYGMWDFECSLVRSINLSGHKFGLVYPGLGWLLFRDKRYFHSELNIKSSYLCGVSDSFTVNFSRSFSLVLAQYFNFLHYGFGGYRKIIEQCMANTKFLTQLLTRHGVFEVLSDGKIPVVVFKFKEPIQVDINKFTQLLREKKWMLPYYKLSGKMDITVMRIVVRNDMKEFFLVQLVNDLFECYATLVIDGKPIS
ncbi:glutamate decarboxylase [Flavivirga aquimarina]|uniref:Glutamate decarboxylase n=1 Tax=Flavivirga aquimarina TaxID=2027862 RepID=A0ABT8WBJ0_9FLAO|nr:glutamate decarboxylase [Flavivirga aquimarina]MDO5970503.1 glutamate decarboxylase [Flavivirga aquimarina]